MRIPRPGQAHAGRQAQPDETKGAQSCGQPSPPLPQPGRAQQLLPRPGSSRGAGAPPGGDRGSGGLRAKRRRWLRAARGAAAPPCGLPVPQERVGRNRYQIQQVLPGDGRRCCEAVSDNREWENKAEISAAGDSGLGNKRSGRLSPEELLTAMETCLFLLIYIWGFVLWRI